MPTKILICDDSSFARKQMARALPASWDVDIQFACNGSEALEVLAKDQIELTFLDLNMPVMDGYQVLEQLQTKTSSTKIIVVSGDIQPDAHKRVMKNGALDFIKKPVDAETIESLLQQLGTQIGKQSMPGKDVPQIQVDLLDYLQELTNVAMGTAGDLLARLLKNFVQLGIPNVNMIEGSELHMAVSQIGRSETVSAVCQGFVGAGVAGEAFLMFNESSYHDMADLMHYRGELDESMQLELLMDISSLLIGACINSVADQLDIQFSQGHPMVLGQHLPVEDLISRNASKWKKTLAIEINYQIENRNINCDLLLLFSEDSLEHFNQRLSYMLH